MVYVPYIRKYGVQIVLILSSRIPYMSFLRFVKGKKEDGMWNALEKRSFASFGEGRFFARQCAMTSRFRLPPMSSSEDDALFVLTEAVKDGTLIFFQSEMITVAFSFKVQVRACGI
jgi:hypothetical protein